jgi:hypothetical protein
MNDRMSRRTLLGRGLALGAVAAGAAATLFGAAPATAAPLPYFVQTNWWWCNWCRNLYYSESSNRSAGVCGYGGQHYAGGSWEYRMGYDVETDPTSTQFVQSGWRWCNKCSCLWYAGGTGACAAGGVHQYSVSYNYFLFFNNTADVRNQRGWAHCGQCRVLFYGPHMSSTRCPADRYDVHGPNYTYNYQVMTPQGD